MTIFGTSGDDNLTGTGGIDDFDVHQGGQDTIHAKAGDDTIAFGATFDAGDTVDGGGGNDIIVLRGNYAFLDVHNFMINSVETLKLSKGFDYSIVFESDALDAGEHMTVDASRIGAAHALTFDGTPELDGRYTVTGGAGSDHLQTGAGDDEVFGGGGTDFISAGTGTDVVNGGDGNDILTFFLTALDATDQIDGGRGSDTLELVGPINFTFTEGVLNNIEAISLFEGSNYTLAFAGAPDLHTAAHEAFAIEGTSLNAGNTMTVDCSGLRVSLALTGGDGTDVLTGARRADSIAGGLGADTMDGGAGGDTFLYDNVTQSTGPGFDTIVGFDTHFDIISPLFASGVTVDAVDPAVTHGTLSLENFDDDLEQAIGAAELDDGDAVLFKARHGTLADQWFVIVDGNGTAGYQAGEDLVIHLEAPRHIADLIKANFSPPG